MDRRNLLKSGVAAAVTVAASANSGRARGSASASSNVGRAFNAWVRKGTESRLERVRLLPLGPRSVLLRTEAAHCCYSMCDEVLDPSQQDVPKIIGHGGIGVVEEIGTQVKRVKVGDRVICANTPQCGSCYHCLQGRSDMCEVKEMPLVPVAQLEDGTAVVGHNNYGGIAELMVAFEEYLVPTSTRVPPIELAVLHCVGGAGLAATLTFVPVEAGTNVAIMGCGPIGLSAVQGARIMGARQIIAIEPIAYRRELAEKLGATTVLDPNAEGAGLVDKVQTMCRGETPSIFAGGRDWRPDSRTGKAHARPIGADFVIEAAGSNRFVPKAGAGPDAAGLNLDALEQAYLMTDGSGHLTTTGVYRGNISFPASTFTISGRTHHSGQLGGGANSFRDMQRFIRLIEKGQYDARSLATGVFPLEKTREAFQAVADRTTVASIIAFS